MSKLQQLDLFGGYYNKNTQIKLLNELKEKSKIVYPEGLKLGKYNKYKVKKVNGYCLLDNSQWKNGEIYISVLFYDGKWREDKFTLEDIDRIIND